MRNVGSAIGHASVELADQAGARCIICPTRSGRTARLVSTFRPDLPIYAISAHDETLRRCCFLWGVEALKTIERGTVTDMIYGALTLCRERGVVSPGDVVVVTAGDPQTSPRQGDYTTPTNIALIAQVQ